MNMDLAKMLERCQKGQWNVNDFDWSQKPLVALSKEKEIEVCTYYLNMSYIERLAGALFLSLSKRMEDSTLKAIYETFYADELRHSHAAAKLMDYFDVHHYRFYTPSKAMLNFIPYFCRSIETLNPAFANMYITGGEFILDIALLRGLNDYVDDPMSRAVVEKINQDESRHIAMDLFMTQYCSEHKMGRLKGKKQSAFLSRDFWGVMMWGPDFFNEVFFRPMQAMDPTNAHMKDVVRRVRKFFLRPEVQNNPSVKNFNDTAKFLESPLGARVGTFLEQVGKRATGLDFSWVRAGNSKTLHQRQAGIPETELGGEKLHRELTSN